jgi:outer membrane protein assembly factor BamB
VLACGPAARSQDWPNWRGPHRNGAVSGGTIPTRTWGKEGPKLLWKSEPIPGGGDGGYASPVVAEGRVYLYVAWKYRVPLATRTLTSRNLARLGAFSDNVPRQLLEKVEAARLADDLAKLKGKETKAWIEGWIAANLDAEQKKQFGRFVRDRLNRGGRAQPLKLLAKLQHIKDKVFTIEQFDQWLKQNLRDEHQEKLVRKHVPEFEPRCRDVMICLDAASGRTVWEKRYEGAPRGHGSSSTPCIYRGRCYVGGSDGVAYCFDARTGEEVWKTKAGKGEINSSFAVGGGRAVVQAGPLTAFDAGTGTVLWTQPDIRSRNTSPVIWQSGGRSYVLCNDKKVSCVDLADGRILWQVPGGGESTPAVSGDTLAVLVEAKKGQDGLLVYRISPRKAERLCSAPVSARGCSPIVDGDRVYALGRGKAVCVDSRSGRILWKATVRKEDWASPILAGGKVVALLGGSLSLLDVSGEAAEVIASARLGPLPCASPALAAGRLFVRGKDAVLCYDLAAGTHRPSTQPPAARK